MVSAVVDWPGGPRQRFTDDKAHVTTSAHDEDLGVLYNVEGPFDYEYVAASATDQVCGGTGAVGDYLLGVLIVPETTAAGTCAIQDGSGTAMNIFIAGTLPSLQPFFVPLKIRSTGGAWSVTTGANVHAIAIGIFTP